MADFNIDDNNKWLSNDAENSALITEVIFFKYI